MTTRRRHTFNPVAPLDQGQVIVSRRAAFGDVIGATIVADELARLGYRVQFNTLPQIVSSGVLQHHQSITSFGRQDAPCHVDLNDKYERSELRKTRSAMSLFYESAHDQLARLGVQMRPECNLRPQLAILPHEVDVARQMLSPFPRPWVAVIPRSNAWPNRTTQPSLWQETAPLVDGTLLWTGTDRINDKLVVDLRCGDMRRLMATLAAADLVVGVDTGPMWCAVGVNAPILGLSQARPFRVLFNDQIDWWDVSPPGLDCIGCSEHSCPINVLNPPCQRIPAPLLAQTITDRLESVRGHKVSAVIPCLHDRDPRIPRCIEAVLPQVDEVIVSLDGHATGDRLPKHPKIRLIYSPAGKTGFGKTCNRGARAAKGRYIMFLNDDLYLAANAVRQLKLVACQDKVAIVGGLWRYPDGTIQHGGGNRGAGDVGFGHLDWKQKTATHTDPVEMEFVTAACMMVRREAFYAVGGFGEEFGNYSEDADLCMKVRERGWKVMFNPRATAIHDESQTTKPEKQEMLKAAHIVFKQKWQRYFAHNPPGALGVFT